MPGTSRARNPRGYEIEFDEATHAYTSLVNGHITPTGAVVVGSGGVAGQDGEDPCVVVRYTSVTSFVGHFFRPFDAAAASERVAAKRGVSPAVVRAEWEANKIAACTFGTRVHETCEDVLRRRVGPDGRWAFRNRPNGERERRVFSAAFRAASRVAETCDVLGVEQVVFDVDCRLAGTIDCLARSRKTGRLVILDWKTNARLDESSPWGDKALDPISHLDDCAMEHYRLQLAAYEMLLRKAGYISRTEPVERVVVHLTEDGPVMHALPCRAVEVRDMLVAMLEQPPF